MSGASGTGQVGDLVTAAGATTSPSGAVGTGLAGVLAAVASVDVVINSARANLIYELALLHGLVPGSPLTVSATQRSAGALMQTVSGTGPVTVTTTASDVLQGDVNDWIDALAAVHGLTAPLVVTTTARTAGSLAQTISTVGATTTVTTP